MSEKLFRGKSFRNKILFGFMILGGLLFVSSSVRAEEKIESNIFGAKKDFLLSNEGIKIEIENNCLRSSLLCQEKKDEGKSEREKYYEAILAGYPLAEMAQELAKQSEDVAAYLIAISKKESVWGVHSPSKNGQDCYNYWGYKGKEDSQVLGYSCFSSREEAVRKVGARIENLMEKGLDTPEKIVVWKCGSSCAGHDPASVSKWIADIKSVLKSLQG